MMMLAVWFIPSGAGVPRIHASMIALWLAGEAFGIHRLTDKPENAGPILPAILIIGKRVVKPVTLCHLRIGVYNADGLKKVGNRHHNSQLS